LDKHLSASLDFSQLSKDDRDASLDFLKSRVNLQKKHIQLIEDIKKEIEESDQDVY
jgi:predicted transcriptional regulator